MKYDFDSVVDRHGFSDKWDEAVADEIPMWIADMDFETAPEIKDALIRRAQHGVFGYATSPSKEWYDAYIRWWDTRHHFKIDREWLLFCAGVIPTISSTVRKLTTPAENVLVLTPVYNMFYNSIYNNGRNILECPLAYENGRYRIDFADLERKLADEQTTLMILCNPHNPVGKIWDKATLARIGELATRYGVVVLSDEIHCDLVAPDKEYTPFASVNETCRNNSITAIAPTKTFNLAGIQTSAIVIPNPYLRHKVWRAINTDEVAEPNAFAIAAAVAAFTQGAPWLDELRGYIREGRTMLEEALAKRLPEVKLVSEDATYLMWLDCSAVTADSAELAQYLRSDAGLFLSGGEQYRGNGGVFLRMNIACPHKTLAEGIDRLCKGIRDYQGSHAPIEKPQPSPAPAPAAPTAENDGEFQLDAGLLAFLEADSYEKKLEILSGLHATVTDEMIDTMAVSLDIEVKDGDIEQRYQEVLNCLLTMERFECNRLR